MIPATQAIANDGSDSQHGMPAAYKDGDTAYVRTYVYWVDPAKRILVLGLTMGHTKVNVTAATQLKGIKAGTEVEFAFEIRNGERHLLCIKTIRPTPEEGEDGFYV